MVKHNTMLFDNHLRKDWQPNVKTGFDQPAKKNKRMAYRKHKLATLYPRPVDKLRPVVRCQTFRYKDKIRFGRGFTLEEIKEAKLSPLVCKQVGIAIDCRRANKSVEEKQMNVERLKKYLSKLILFPKGKVPKKESLMIQAKRLLTHTKTLYK